MEVVAGFAAGWRRERRRTGRYLKLKGSSATLDHRTLAGVDMPDDEGVTKTKASGKATATGGNGPDDPFRLMGRCLGEIVAGGIVAAGMMIVASGIGWLAEFLEEHVHRTDFGHFVFELVDKASLLLDATLWLALVSLSIYRLIRDMLKL